MDTVHPLHSSLVTDGLGRTLRSGRVSIRDTDYILNQVTARVKGTATPWAALPRLGERVFAARHVFDELYRDDGYGNRTKFHKLTYQAANTRQRTVPWTTYRDMFEQDLLPKITWVEMGGLYSDHELAARVLAVRNGKGASDVPTAQLAVLLSRCRPVVFSHDQHLFKAGVAPRPPLLAAASAADDLVARGENAQASAGAVGAGAVAATDWLVRALGRGVGAPQWASRLTAAAIIAVALSNKNRRADLSRYLTPVLDYLTVELEHFTEGMSQLAQAHAVVDPEDSIEARAAQALLRRWGDGPLTAPELNAQMRDLDPSYDAISDQQLRHVLADQPCFIEGPRWRYRLGQNYAVPDRTVR